LQQELRVSYRKTSTPAYNRDPAFIGERCLRKTTAYQCQH